MCIKWSTKHLVLLSHSSVHLAFWDVNTTILWVSEKVVCEKWVRSVSMGINNSWTVTIQGSSFQPGYVYISGPEVYFISFRDHVQYTLIRCREDVLCTRFSQMPIPICSPWSTWTYSDTWFKWVKEVKLKGTTLNHPSSLTVHIHRKSTNLTIRTISTIHLRIKKLH